MSQDSDSYPERYRSLFTRAHNQKPPFILLIKRCSKPPGVIRDRGGRSHPWGLLDSRQSPRKGGDSFLGSLLHPPYEKVVLLVDLTPLGDSRD